MTIAEQKYELVNINCMLLNIATIRQPYKTCFCHACGQVVASDGNTTSMWSRKCSRMKNGVVVLKD